MPNDICVDVGSGGREGGRRRRDDSDTEAVVSMSHEISYRTIHQAMSTGYLIIIDYNTPIWL